MDAGTIISIIALVISIVFSLVSLQVAVIQLIWAFSNTISGYFRCAPSVIGVWHKTRKLYYSVWDFRFGVHYILPHIAIMTPMDLERARNDGEQVFLLSSPTLGKEPHGVLKSLMHKPLYHNRAKQSNPITIRRVGTQTIDPDPEKAPEHVAVTGGFKRIVIGSRDARPPLVTWLRLMHELHLVYASYWPKDCASCVAEALWDVGESSLERYADSIERDWRALAKGESINTLRTSAAVTFRSWTWDSNPAGVERPLAESTIGDIVVLALRMGMHWQVLNDGHLCADGNGYAISTTEVGGLGIVLRFTDTGFHAVFPRVIPSTASDKLLCGIIPGCPDLVEQDFRLVSNGRKAISIGDEGGLLHRIGVSERMRKRYAYSDTHNELVALLCPFLPQKGSTIAQFNCPVWPVRPLAISFPILGRAGAAPARSRNTVERKNGRALLRGSLRPLRGFPAEAGS